MGRTIRALSFQTAWNAPWPAQFSPLNYELAFLLIIERKSRKYGAARTPRYVHMGVGRTAQNLLLEAVTLGWVGCPSKLSRTKRFRRPWCCLWITVRLT
jgi:nitroreductase